MSQFTRRDFLATSSLAMAALSLGARVLPADALRHRIPATRYLPDTTDAAQLRALAAQAMNAAREAGATYADIRIGERRTLSMVLYDGWLDTPFSTVASNYSYGVHALVNGVWTFTFGTIPTVDAVTSIARQSVAAARDCVTLAPPMPSLAPAAAVHDGEWSTPYTIDPFTIPLDEHANMLGALRDTVHRVPGIATKNEIEWTAETRVFTSTEGSMLTQHLRTVRPRTKLIRSFLKRTLANVDTPVLVPQSGGFEAIQPPLLQERLKESAEEIIRLTALPERMAEIGRYEAVFDGTSFSTIIGATLSPALELERALGNSLDGAGSSFLAPPNDMLGHMIGSPRLTMIADRTPPNFMGARWDDEGVATEPVTLIKDGHLVDYLTTRATAPLLRSWYERQGVPVRARGYAMASTPMQAPTACTGHLTVLPSQSGQTLDDLCQGVQQGVLVRYVSNVSADQELSSGSVNQALLLKIERGKIVHRIRGATLQFKTQPFFAGITAIGSQETASTAVLDTMTGQPWSAMTQTIMAPAAHAQRVDVILKPQRT